MQSIESFIERYRTVFETFSAPAILEQYAFPLQVSGDRGADVTLAVFATKEEWARQIEGLLANYRKLGVQGSQVRSLQPLEVSPALRLARVHWALLGDGDRLIYEFHAAYTLANVGDGFRVAAIAHDEIPRLRAALGKSA
jgi:hypothetical protein